MRQLYKLEDLTGYRLQSFEGEIGKLKQIYFDDKRWIVRYFVVHTGSWLLGEDVLIAPTAISAVNEEKKFLEVDLTREQIKNCPAINTALPVSRHYEQEYYRHYGWEPYWIGDPIFGPAPTMPLPPVEEKPEHPYLRSSDVVKNYSIHASDDDIGHVEDFILEEPGWAIRYLEVDTHNWLPGKHVLVAPTWIEQVDWKKQEVAVKLKRAAIQKAPFYDPAKIISREYQVALYKYYGLKFEAEGD